MEISGRGRQFIREREGLRLKAYRDGGDVWTIGYGHTKEVRAGDNISFDKAEVFFEEDIDKAISVIEKYVEVELSQNQFDALTSFIFNVGGTAFAHSTMLKKLNTGDFSGAAEQFDRWVYDNKKKIEGLVARRKLEKALFLLPVEEKKIIISKSQPSWISSFVGAILSFFRRWR